MRMTMLAATICLMAGAPAVAIAAQKAPGASGYAPGQEMQSRGGSASSYAPGQMKKRKGSQSASEFAPGDRMNDKRQPGSSGY